MGKRRSVGMRIDHPSGIFGRPRQLVKISVVFRARDLFSTEGYGKYQAQTREGVWVVSFFIFYFFLQRHDRGQNEQRSWKYGNMEIWKYGNMEIWKWLRQICRASVRDVIST